MGTLRRTKKVIEELLSEKEMEEYVLIWKEDIGVKISEVKEL